MTDLETNDDELFSMDDLEKDLKKARGARRLPWFATGLILGIAGTIFLPVLLAPYLPAIFRSNREFLTGPVLEKEIDGGRLLLTVQAEPGAFIASFSERVAEISMLVDRGDTVTLAVPDYDPFIENPDVEGVRKGSPAGATEEAGVGGPPEGDDAEGDRVEGEVQEGDGAEGEVQEGDRREGSSGAPPDTTGSEGPPPDPASGSER